MFRAIMKAFQIGGDIKSIGKGRYHKRIMVGQLDAQSIVVLTACSSSRRFLYARNPLPKSISFIFRILINVVR